MQTFADSYTGGKTDTKPLKAIAKTAGLNVQIKTSRLAPQTQSWMPWATDQLDAIAALEPNWDSYGGEPPSPEAIKGAEFFLQTVHQSFGNYDHDQSQPQIVAPRADGGIQMEWGTYSAEIDVHVDASGVLGYLFIDQQGTEPIYREVQMASLEDALQWVARVVFTVPR